MEYNKYEDLFFLSQSYSDCINRFEESIVNNKQIGWDLVVITASNENQANSYIKQIEYRKNNRLLPSNLNFIVIPDDKNKRIGSGGATLNVIKILKEHNIDFDNSKILLIHSGGDSKRIPQYSACGKLFSHVPRRLIDNKPSTLFDEFMVTLCSVPERLKSGILVVSGDVLLLFNYLQLDVFNENAIAISMKEKVEIGKNHGVFLTDNKGMLNEFLHKNSIDELVKKGASDDHNMVDIDTGLIWIDSNVTNALLSLITTDNKIDEEKKSKYINDVNRLSFYGDLLYPLSKNGTLDEYLKTSAEGINDVNLQECRKNIWEKLNNYNMKVIKTFPSKFIHVGTTDELRKLNITAKKNYSFLNWDNNILSNVSSDNFSTINTYVKDNVILGENSFVEDSILENAVVGKNSILTGANFTGHVPDNTVLQILPIKINDKNYYIARVYSIYDNPKEFNMYMNNTIDDFLNNNNLNKSDLWGEKENISLWDANLFEICNTEQEALNAYDRLIRMCNNKASIEDIKEWKESERLSLSSSYVLADMDIIISRQDNIDNLIRTDLIITQFNNGVPVDECCNFINKKNVSKIVNLLIKRRSDKNYNLDYLLSYITEKYSDLFPLESDRFLNECYKKIGNSIKLDEKLFTCLEPTSESIVKKPVRINFGGGWSDTPPYCLENGGTVLNASILLNDKMPIEVKVNKYKEGKYKFNSVDLNSEIEYTDKSELMKYNKVGDPFILSKAALHALNIIDSEYLGKYGIEITTNVDVPAGSGLGTSSILIGAIVIALAKFYKIELTEQDIYNLILKVEQDVSTGGGWQDQIGGISPGIKLIETQKGLKQNYNIQHIEFNKNIEELENRMVLIYTGQRRIAKNLLRKMMNKYMKNDLTTMTTLKEIQHIALIMKFELEKGDIDSFAKLLTKHFNMVKNIDEGITNVCIDHIISSCNEYLSGYTIAGAGGGGFLFAVLKKGEMKEQLKEKLHSIYRENGIKVYDCSFVRENDIY